MEKRAAQHTTASVAAERRLHAVEMHSSSNADVIFSLGDFGQL